MGHQAVSRVVSTEEDGESAHHIGNAFHGFPGQPRPTMSHRSLLHVASIACVATAKGCTAVRTKILAAGAWKLGTVPLCGRLPRAAALVRCSCAARVSLTAGGRHIRLCVRDCVYAWAGGLTYVAFRSSERCVL